MKSCTGEVSWMESRRWNPNRTRAASKKGAQMLNMRIPCKRVLFVAEKMAALSVVHDRLIKTGLRDVCLELHSRAANKRAVLGELERTLSHRNMIPATPGPPVVLREARDRLTELAATVHRNIGNSGETVFSVIGQQSGHIGGGHPPPKTEVGHLNEASATKIAALKETLKRYGDLVWSEGNAAEHPFHGVRNLALQPVDLERLTAILSEVANATATLADQIRETSSRLGAAPPISFGGSAQLVDVLRTLSTYPKGQADLSLAMLTTSDLHRLHAGIAAGARWRESHEQLVEVFVESAIATSPPAIRSDLATGTVSFFARWRKPYRNASLLLAGLLRAQLPKTARERVDLVDRLEQHAAVRATWEPLRDFARRRLETIG